MNRYNSIIPRLIHWSGPWAITLGQTSYFTCSESEVSERWHRHEDEHKRQWKEDGWRFAFWYLRNMIKAGYKDSEDEVRARKAADSSATSVVKGQVNGDSVYRREYRISVRACWSIRILCQTLDGQGGYQT